MTDGTVTYLADYLERRKEMNFTDERATSITDSLARSPQYEFSESTIGFEPDLISKRVAQFKEDRPTISTEALYPDLNDPEPTLMVMVIRLLQAARKYLNEAMESAKREDWFASDNAMMLFENLLPELFCCREIGDGFGLIINDLNVILKNKYQPFNLSQISIIYNVVTSLYHRPFLDFDQALDKIEVFRKNGLNPDIAELDALAEIPDLSSEAE